MQVDDAKKEEPEIKGNLQNLIFIFKEELKIIFQGHSSICMNNNDSELSAENFPILIDTKNIHDTRYLRSQGKTCNPLQKIL